MELYLEAIQRFRHLYNEAQKTSLEEPTVVSLATVGEDGRPAVRTMGISKFDEHGFVFFTNSRSRKGRQLNENPYAAFCFFCQPLHEQCTIEGHVEITEEEEADMWWASRSRDIKFAAWASDQSSPLENLELLERRVQKCHEQFVHGRVPRPPHWLGYRLIPSRYEFWRTGWRRLHERICYVKDGEIWSKTLLNP